MLSFGTLPQLPISVKLRGGLPLAAALFLL